MPLSSNSLNLAGRSSKVGGTVTRTFGWIILTLGLIAGFGTLATCGAIVGFASAAPYLFGIPTLVLSVLVGWLLLRSGRQLEHEGVRTQKLARTQAVFALATVRGGVLTAFDAAHSLGCSVPEADALLTSLAKEQSDHVTLDIDEQGNVLYRFKGARLGARTSQPSPGTRVEVTPNVRVETEPGEPLEADEAWDELERRPSRR